MNDLTRELITATHKSRTMKDMGRKIRGGVSRQRVFQLIEEAKCVDIVKQTLKVNRKQALEDKRISCVYTLTVGNAKYYGSTSHYERRKHDHIMKLRGKIHYNEALQTQYNSGHTPVFKILVESEDPKHLLKLENIYITNDSNCCNNYCAIKPVRDNIKTNYNGINFHTHSGLFLVHPYDKVTGKRYYLGYTKTIEQGVELIKAWNPDYLLYKDKIREYKGVVCVGGYFQARPYIKEAKHYVYLGNFKTKEDAKQTIINKYPNFYK